MVFHRTRRLRVLLVEDDELVRDSLALQLAAYGYDVVHAEEGMAALALMDTGEPVDLLIADLATPGMNVLSLIAEARRRRPRLPALLLTGSASTDAGFVAGAAAGGSFALLLKRASDTRLADCAAALLKAA